MAGKKPAGDGRGASLLDRRGFLGAAGSTAASLGLGAGLGRASAATSDPPVDVGSVAVDHAWRTVRTEHAYADPVVVAPALSYRGTQPATTRVRNVGGDAFELAVEEWLYLDGRHLDETAGYLAMDAGSYALADDTALEIGRVRTDHRWASRPLSGAFSTRPVVFSQAQTVNGTHPVVTRHRDVSPDGIDVRLQEEEARGPHREEDIGYLAVDSGTGALAGHAFEAGVRSGVGEQWQTVEFDRTYERPALIADVQTFRGSNTCGVRYRNLTQSTVDLKVEEEESRDAETGHLGERVGYLVVDAEAGDTSDGSGDLTRRARIERRIHEYTNEARVSRGLGTLNFDTDLREIARYHSRDMAHNDYFAHTSPSGETMGDRYDAFGYDCQAGGYYTGGENIAYTYASGSDSADAIGQEIVRMWMNSQGHRENILNSAWANEGVGVYVGSDGRVYATQNFC